MAIKGWLVGESDVSSARKLARSRSGTPAAGAPTIAAESFGTESLRAEARLWSPLPFAGKTCRNLSNRKVGSFRRERRGNWRQADRRLVTAQLLPFIPVYRVSYFSVSAPASPIDVSEPSFFLSSRPSRRVLARRPHAASWHLIFACVPTLRSVNIQPPRELAWEQSYTQVRWSRVSANEILREYIAYGSIRCLIFELGCQD